VAAPPVSLHDALRDRYDLRRELGSGGTATVYLARDLKHDRDVALKVLHAQWSEAVASERFLREIKLAARLHHPHLLPLYDSGEASGALYYVVPYIEGGSLRDQLHREGRLPLGLALRLAREAAEALDYAHRQGVVHRDIKPENILIDERHAVVADFGVARALDAAAGSRLTHTGLLVGTPAYMSPEQASADPVDGRSDVYSLGSVLFELLAGRPPFTGSSALAIISQRFTTPPPSLADVGVSVPPEVEDSISRALATRAEARFRTAAEFADALEANEGLVSRPGSTPTGVRRPTRATALAVLPFVNLTSDSENEYFSDGMTEELINAFTKLPDLHVASRTSVYALQGKGLDVRELAQKLNVGVILEGSVRRAGTRMRLTAQLVNAADGYHLWSETYDRELADVFAVQDELSRGIVATLKLKFLAPEDASLVDPPTDNFHAYTLYLKGRYFLNKRTPTTLAKGIDCFEEAIRADPQYALAYSGLADSYHMLALYGSLRPKEAYPKAKAAASKALELDDSRAEGHVSAAYVALCYDWEFERAEREFRRAIELNPQSGDAYHWLAWCLLCLGRKPEAAAAARRAMALEPLSPVVNARSGQILTYAGYPEEGLVGSEHALELDPEFIIAMETLAITYTAQGRYEEAIQTLERSAGLPGSTARFLLPLVLASSGQLDEAVRLQRELEVELSAGHGSPGGIVWAAVVWHIAGDTDQAFAWLERAYQARHFGILLLKADPVQDRLRPDPRLAELLRKIGLE
jgi:serine/threonine protein kinase/tetratricopeptide (TPR) repeat protein